MENVQNDGRIKWNYKIGGLYVFVKNTKDGKERILDM